MRFALLLLAVSASPAFAGEPTTGLLPATRTGILITAEDPARRDDPRLRRLAWRLWQARIESHLAVDLAQPPADAARRIKAARDKIGNARAATKRRQPATAARLYDQALDALQNNAHRRAHLNPLIDALIERARVALTLKDSATAEALFLRVLAFVPAYEPTNAQLGRRGLKLFGQVRRVVSARPAGTLVVMPGPLAEPRVRVDFGDPLAPPYTARLSVGTHFVSVSAPGRALLVTRVRVRANEERGAFVRPPLAGSVDARTDAVRRFRPNESTARARVSRLSGLGLLLVARFAANTLKLSLYDDTGGPVRGGEVQVSAHPSDADLDRAIQELVESASIIEPVFAPAPATTAAPWYGTWWGVTLIGIAVAGAAAGTVVALSGGETEYVFRP